MKRSASSSSRKAVSRPAPSPPYVMPYDPVAFVGWAGRGKREVEIWITEAVLDEREVRAFDRRKNRWIGGISGQVRVASREFAKVQALKERSRISPVPARYFEEAKLCSDDLQKLAKKHHVSAERVMQVNASFLLETYHGHGIGVALYLALCSLARKLNLALAADACFASSTSVQARRVWNSSEFRSYVDVGESDLVGVWVGPQARTS